MMASIEFVTLKYAQIRIHLNKLNCDIGTIAKNFPAKLIQDAVLSQMARSVAIYYSIAVAQKVVIGT